jgi:MoaA/NifB/PqqE/SkfB family radical SAM enzyme
LDENQPVKEIPLTLLLKAVTPRRLFNAGLALSSFAVSVATKRPTSWGRPFILTVEPTNICNLSCPLCVTGNGRMTRRAGLMNFDQFKTVVDQIGDYLFYLLLYQQGEPFINRDFLKFVEYAKQRSIFVTTSTNGHYLNLETARQTVASGMDTMIVSIDGADQQSYETYRVGGQLAKVVSGIRNLIREREKLGNRTPKIFIQFIVMRHNEQQIAEMKSLTRDLGVDKLLIKTAHVENREEAEQWLPENSRLARYRIEGENLLPKRIVKGACPRPWTSALVNWDGVVVPCCFDKNARHTFGAASHKNSFDKIWTSQKYESFRDRMLNNRGSLEICANCSQGIRLYR